MKQDMIVILDLGSTENTVLARAIRDFGVYSEIYPHDITVDALKALPNVKGIILNGGENRIVDGIAIDIAPEIYQAGYPILAVDHESAACAEKISAWPTDAAAYDQLLKTFLFDTCHAEANWSMTNFIADQVELLKKTNRR